MGDGSINAECKSCGGKEYRFDREQPDQQVVCNSCEAEVGSFRDVQDALRTEGVRIMNDAIADLKKKLRKSGWK